MEENFRDIFELNTEDFVDKEERKESVMYKVNAKDGKDNVYKSLIRFLPWWKDPVTGSKIRKYSYWLEDPLTGDGFSVDCPTTKGPKEKSVVQDVFFKLWKSNNVAEKKLADKFKRRENYYALVQILKDEQKPEMVGKIKIFKFGIKLNNVVQGELKPEFGKPYNPFNPLTGRILALHVSLNGSFNDYTQSKFVGEEFPALMDNVKIDGSEETMKKYFEYLKEKSPNLEDFSYKEWDEEMHAKVKSVIENTVPSMRTTEHIVASVNDESPAEPAQDISLDLPSQESSPVDNLTLDIPSESDEAPFDADLYKDL